MIVVFSRPGRELLTAETLRQLEDRGGGSQLPPESKALFWVGETQPPPVPWRCVVVPQPPRGSVPDFWLLLRTFSQGDLVVLEDDVSPCRNALPYMDRWTSPHFTTFFNGRARPLGALLDGTIFALSQAIKIPRRLADRLRDQDPAVVHLRDYDLVIGTMLRAWGEPVHYHRSIIQHVGAVSVKGNRGRPVAADFVGVDFDALTLLQGQEATQTATTSPPSTGRDRR